MTEFDSSALRGGSVDMTYPENGLQAYPKRRFTKFGAVACGLAIAAYTGASLTCQTTERALAAPSPAYCPAPSAYAEAVVRRLFTGPGPSRAPSTAQLRAAADKNSLSMITAKPPRLNKGATPGQAIRTSNNYLANFGISVDIGTQPYRDYEPPTASEINSGLVKNLNVLTKALSSQSVQYVALSGIKRVTMESSANNNQLFYMDDNKIGDNVYVNLYYASTPLDVDEMLAVGVDTAECGGIGPARIDPGFALLNGKDIYGGLDKHSGMMAYYGAEYSQLNANYSAKIASAEQSFDKSAYCQLTKQKASVDKLVVTTEPSGFDGLKYDKAVTMQAFGEPGDFKYFLDPSHPVLRQKFLFELARLYDRAPRLVGFLSQVSSRYQASKPAYKCD